MKDLRKIVSVFFRIDETRPFFRDIIYDGEYGNATDGQAVIRWKNDSAVTDGKTPNIKNIFLKEYDTITTFVVSDYQKWKKALPLVPYFTTCEYCEGNKEVTWEFEHFKKQGKCPHCKGEGGFKDDNLMVPDPEKHYKFAERHFDQKQIEKLVHVLKCLDKNEVLIETNSKNLNQALFAKIDEFEILIMPMIKY